MNKKSCTFALANDGNVSVAQQVEHIPFKDGVLGSNPSWNTTAVANNRWLLFFYYISSFLYFCTKIQKMVANFFSKITHVVDGNCYISSDFHLGSFPISESEAREKRIVNWLTSIENKVDHLFLLGDIFDFWFEYRYVVPKGFYRFFSKLKELSERGVHIYFFTGNHDMWVKNYLQEEFGVKIFYSPQYFVINGEICLLGHGDGLGKGQWGYKCVKRIFACPLNIFLYGLLPSSWAFGLANFISRKSRKANTKSKHKRKKRHIDEYMLQYIKDFPKDIPVRYFIFGHRHLPLKIELDHSTYFNTGDWLWHDSYLYFSKHEAPKLYVQSKNY